MFIIEKRDEKPVITDSSRDVNDILLGMKRVTEQAAKDAMAISGHLNFGDTFRMECGVIIKCVSDADARKYAVQKGIAGDFIKIFGNM